MRSKSTNPIFVLGVPRSGTTLYRIALDSHTEIAGAPETGWLTGGYCSPSLRELAEMLVNHKNGPVKNLSGVESETIIEAARAFLDQIFSCYLEYRKKSILVLKTPDDIPYLNFLEKLYPNARYLHITRDGRDVACSTYALKGTFFNNAILKEHGDLTILNALRRWVDWENQVHEYLADKSGRALDMKYEDLVRSPIEQLKRTCEFIGTQFEPGMLDYLQQSHEYPDYEAGSQSVKGHSGYATCQIGRWLTEVPLSDWKSIDKVAGELLVHYGYGLCVDRKVQMVSHIKRKRWRWWRLGK